ncbi:MAG TPA: hypothetical protein PK405_04025 [Hyphomicrobiales bacterium]|nr:hypothetical protein [Rhodobiaceae bacterium]MCB2009971.1 hypothetical protein [Geminicoccaceae bacterium]HXK53831.1 hypothetical protein [Hyphomicrobiales bacterium]
MLLLRLFGLFLMAMAFVAFIVDGVKTIASNTLVMTPLGEIWSDINGASLTRIQTLLSDGAYALLWDPVLLSLLAAPGWLVLAFLGMLVHWLGRRREATSAIANEG